MKNTGGIAHLKIIHASRGSIHEYENVKRKLYNRNAYIYFNQKCSQKQLIPHHAKIKIPRTSPAARFTQHKVHNLRSPKNCIIEINQYLIYLCLTYFHLSV